jgi:O-acetylserine/cysteine efflux transporter
MVYPVTLLGFGAWSWLFSRYPAATVAPFMLLVPIFGFGSSTLVLGEPFLEHISAIPIVKVPRLN